MVRSAMCASAGWAGRDDPKPSGGPHDARGRAPAGVVQDSVLEFIPTLALGVRAEMQDSLCVLFGPQDAGTLEAEVDDAQDRRLYGAAAKGLDRIRLINLPKGLRNSSTLRASRT